MHPNHEAAFKITATERTDRLPGQSSRCQLGSRLSKYAVAPDLPGTDYKKIKALLITDQGGLCAYCETRIAELDGSLQRVEHFHPKSDQSNPSQNWALDWNNIMAVCLGGEKSGNHDNPAAIGSPIYKLPENLSCDAHKNHYFNTQAGKAAGLSAQLLALENPLASAAFPCLYGFDKQNGIIFPNSDQCEKLDQLKQLARNTTHDKLLKTIEVLNLNCDRLCAARLEILKAYNREFKQAREKRDGDFNAKLAEKWFRRRWPSFFTTRRILLGDAAEKWLKQQQYNG